MSDKCRPVEVDGEIIRVHGIRKMTPEEVDGFAEIVRAAKHLMANEPPRACSVDGCERKFYAHDLCGMHYQRRRIYGTTDLPSVEVDTLVWIDAVGALPTLYLHWCSCENPVLTDTTTAAQCDDCTAPQVCAIPGCLGARMARYLLCSKHTHIRYRNGHPLWKRGPLTYRAAHNRVVRTKGRADDYPCIDGCGRIAKDWSYDGAEPDELVDPKHGLPYSLNPERYEPRCRGCHTEHDRQRDALGRFTS